LNFTAIRFLEVIVYSPFSRKGTIRQQDIQACNIARSAIARSLEFEARRTAVLVSAIIQNVMLNRVTPRSVEELWQAVQDDVILRQIRSRTDANVDSYSRFSGWVDGARRNLATIEQRRLNDEIGFRIYTHQFGNCARLARLHLISA
jgi:hypothetical protein